MTIAIPLNGLTTLLVIASCGYVAIAITAALEESREVGYFAGSIWTLLVIFAACGFALGRWM